MIEDARNLVECVEFVRTLTQRIQRCHFVGHIAKDGLASLRFSARIPHHAHRADRFLYLPLVGLAVAVAMSLRPMGERLAAWQEVGVADGYLGSFAWSVPFDATDEAALRVSDAWDGDRKSVV